MPIQPYSPAYSESPSRQGVRHILVADDDTSFVHLLEENLQIEGYRVSRAYDGQMALRLANQSSIDLIILDVNMPMTNGLRVFQLLRSSAATQRIPIIFITGELSKDVYTSIAEAPRVAHLKKPVDLDHINSLVRHFLETFPTH